MPDRDRLSVWGSFGGLQHGSNKAAPHDIEQQEHAIQQVKTY